MALYRNLIFRKKTGTQLLFAYALTGFFVACAGHHLAFAKEKEARTPEVIIDRVEHKDSTVVVRVKVCNRSEESVYLRTHEFPGLPLLPGLAIEQWHKNRWIIVSDRGDVPTRTVLMLEGGKCVEQDFHLQDFDRIFEMGTERVLIQGRHRASLWYASTRRGALDGMKHRKVAVSEPFVIQPPAQPPGPAETKQKPPQ